MSDRESPSASAPSSNDDEVRSRCGALMASKLTTKPKAPGRPEGAALRTLASGIGGPPFGPSRMITKRSTGLPV